MINKIAMKQNNSIARPPFFMAMIKAKDRLLWRILFAQMSMAYNNSFYEGTGID